MYVCMTKNHFFTYQMGKRVAGWLMIWVLSALALQAQRLTFTNTVVDHGVSVWKKPVTVSFSFTNTDEMQKIKIKHPAIKFHKKNKDDGKKQKDDTGEDGEKPKKNFLKRIFSKKK